ncbi:response regulator transcription factor [Paenibacillus sacheonensis]|uniref:Response regulator n=1 Tax=Paenibacillus sacheonensis TaxID=742054 RepID=A0A7X4YRX5_9BACL|nr:response regulator [Paenibacillus sacheonensis]MBM7566247.1 two-component system response regulator YesN [Paenibacillus sacheonensis]NBC70454.1 response regulator [Paenibacillus sacheonensis]
MFRILIVDDESFERRGVKLLIAKYDLELEVIEADSGEEALDYLQRNPIDILLTDIRMGQMDGLELAEHVRALNLPVKIIFLSAFGEFEYARKAIDLKAMHYILKPVEVHNFLKVLVQVIQMCKDEQKEREDAVKYQEAYRAGIQSEKYKKLTELLTNDDLHSPLRQWEDILPHREAADERCFRMMMLDSAKRLFDAAGFDIEQSLGELIPGKSSFIALNEYQLLAMMEVDYASETFALSKPIGERMIQWIKERFHADVSVAVSGTFNQIGTMREEYRKMEALLESKFFFDDGALLFTESSSEGGEESGYIDQALLAISDSIERKELGDVRTRFARLFDDLKNSERFSVIYVKYICSEIVRSIFNATHKQDSVSFKNNLEKIFKTAQLKDLRQLMLEILQDYGAHDEPTPITANSEATHKVIEDVIQLIERDYRSDLSVEQIAERVYLSPSYLSHLFAKQTGVGLIKYITMLRLEEAKQLLQHTNRKIVDIGNEVGYSNIPYFCTLLKNYYGLTPTQIREGHRP